MLSREHADEAQVSVGRLEDFPPGRGHIRQVGRYSVGIFNVDGKLYALRNTCPHRAAPVCVGQVTGTMLPAQIPGEFMWGLAGRVLHCPWHRWEFDITDGRPLFGIDRRGIVCHGVELVDGQVFVSIRGSVTRDAQEMHA